MQSLGLRTQWIATAHAQYYPYSADFKLQVVEHGCKAGISDIEWEFRSLQNPCLILHNSQGFSHGSANNFNIVQKFIETCCKMIDLKDRLHAIWFDVSAARYVSVY
jgi:hypothetical protein